MSTHTYTAGLRQTVEPITAFVQLGQAGSRSSSSRLCWYAYWVALQKRTSQAGNPWGGVLRGSFLGRSAPVPPTSHYRLESDLGLTDPGKAVPYGQPRSPAAAQPPQFLKPSCPGLQASLALGLGQTQRGKGHNLGLILSRTLDACMGYAKVTCDPTALTCSSVHLLMYSKAHT